MNAHLIALILSLPNPSLGDLRQFPPTPIIRHHREIARRNLEQLRVRQSIDPRWQVQAAIEQAQFSYTCWDTLDTAAVSVVNDHARTADALHSLRHLIGPAAYYSGQMPPLRPSWWCADDTVQHVRGDKQ